MRYTVRNLGPIKKATIDVKPLTIFVGPNNAGKTWAMNLWASIAGPYNHYALIDELLEDGVRRERYQELFAFAQDLVGRGAASIDLVACAPQLTKAYFGDLCRIAPERFSEFMGTTREAFARAAVSMDLADDIDAILTRIAAEEINLRVGGREDTKSLRIRKRRGEGACGGLMSRATSDDPSDAMVHDVAISALLGVIHRAVVRDVTCFPAERSLAFSGFLPTLSPREAAGRPGGEDDSERVLRWTPPQPLLSSVLLARAGARPTRRKPRYAALAALLQRQIVGGRVALDESNGGPQYVFEIPRNKGRLEIAVSSSMVKELAPIAIYLGSQAEEGETLCIDEPEMNLHPEAQARLAEFLGILVNSGLSVMATTHSSYLVDHLANMVSAAKHERPEDVAPMFYLQDSRAFLAPDKVAVYLFEGGTVRSIMDEQGYIDWGTFADVSARISAIHYDL